jgi:hypothetical protein
LDLRLALGLALLARVEPLGEQPPGGVGLAAGDGERRVRVVAQRQHVALAGEAIVEAPAVLVGLHEEQQDQAVTVGQPLARIAGLDGPDRGVGGDEVPCHGVNRLVSPLTGGGTPEITPPDRGSAGFP